MVGWTWLFKAEASSPPLLSLMVHSHAQRHGQRRHFGCRCPRTWQQATLLPDGLHRFQRVHGPSAHLDALQPQPAAGADSQHGQYAPAVRHDMSFSWWDGGDGYLVGQAHEALDDDLPLSCTRGLIC